MPKADTLSIVPLADRVVVKPASKNEEKTLASGIIIPDSSEKERPAKGTVVAVGPGKTTEEGKLIAMNVKIGDKVLFSKYGYEEVKLDGEEYLIIPEAQILGIIK